jgi:FHS family L-fucose permease-like MFS transporter
MAFFVLAAGITILQVAANPYVTVLGDPQTASSRLTLTQAFNSLGTTIGPWLGGMLILSGVAVAVTDPARLSAAEQLANRAVEAASVQLPYLALGAALLGLAIFFALSKLPKIIDAEEEKHRAGLPPILSHRHLVLGAIGIFVYVGGEVSIGSFLINFFGESTIAALKPADAAKYVSFYWGGAMIGRFIGFAVMRTVSPGKTLAFNAGVAILLITIAATTSGSLAMWSIIAVGLFNSIMFPTIFSMALNKLGPQTSQGSGLLCMAIVGGALVPFGQGFLADTIGLQPSFFLPAACYAFILFFGLKYADMYSKKA